jgi:hypothetical protein
MEGLIMVDKRETKEEANKLRQEAREQRQAARSQKLAESGRPQRPDKLCSLSTVEVRKGEEGYQISISCSERQYKVTIPQKEVGPVLRDLEIAFHVIRGQE